MTYRTLAARTLALLAGLVAVPMQPAAAQERALFRWSGTVDREAQLVLRGRDLSVRHHDDRRTAHGDDRSRVLAMLPRGEGTLAVRVEDGRGAVDVVQQPRRENDWTAIVRVRDPRAGADRYRLTATWLPSGDGRIADDGRWDRGDRDDRDDRDGRWGRDDRDGRWDGDDRDGRRGRDDRRGGWDRGVGGALRWRGTVDDVVLLRVAGRRVDDTVLRGQASRDVQVDVRGRGLSARGDAVRLTRVSGRGQVTILEQPNARNGYVALLRIEDSRSGAGWYDLEASW